jgi:hypothetical protein
MIVVLTVEQRGQEVSDMRAKVVGLALGLVACCVAHPGYCKAETIHFHLSGPISSASPSVNAEAGTDNTPHKITYEHPSFITVKGWPVSLPYDNPECGNVIVDALRKNSETYVANKDCRAAMRKAFEIQRTTPPPDPKEIRQAIGRVISGGPEVTNGQAAPQAGAPAQGESSEPGERMPPFLERAPN